PGLALADLADELRASRRGLDALTVNDRASDVRHVFSWSYRTLTEPAARLFRLLGLHPGADVAAPAAASLAGLPLAEVRPLLLELIQANLLTEPIRGRFTFHDLLRAYASELAAEVDSDDERQAALIRLLDHYTHTAHA